MAVEVSVPPCSPGAWGVDGGGGGGPESGEWGQQAGRVLSKEAVTRRSREESLGGGSVLARGVGEGSEAEGKVEGRGEAGGEGLGLWPSEAGDGGGLRCGPVRRS